ncbi:MAG: hypothetical protein NZ533_00500 [Casimicrobiaceae bacterium]|nr:hypothetical protein [Casimicrobiaceae bacterium]MCX8099399.1 hypothetical protein [Casimicrobiaceae bacterium]MDW8311788.1 hypothetical protein [Burkholderiales bacterium]
MSEQHSESFIKTPKQLIIAGVLAFAIPVAVALIAAYAVTGRFAAPPAAPQEREAQIKPAGGFSLLNRDAPSLKELPAK